VTWTLDYSRTSDYADSVGYWHVAPHPEKAKAKGWSRVYYSVNLVLLLRSYRRRCTWLHCGDTSQSPLFVFLYSSAQVLYPWVPEWIQNVVQKQALTQATAWVKIESEKRAPKQAPKGQADTATCDTAPAEEQPVGPFGWDKRSLATLALGMLLGVLLSRGLVSALVDKSPVSPTGRSVLLDPRNYPGGEHTSSHISKAAKRLTLDPDAPCVCSVHRFCSKAPATCTTQRRSTTASFT